MDSRALLACHTTSASADANAANHDDLVVELLAEVRALRGDIASLRTALAVRDQDAAGEALLQEAFAYFGDAEWTADELLAASDHDEGVRAALADAGVALSGPRPFDRLGVLLRRMRGVSVRGLWLVQAAKRNRRGAAVWRLTDIRPSMSVTAARGTGHDAASLDDTHTRRR